MTNPEMLGMMWSHGHNNSIVNGIPRIGYMKGGKYSLFGLKTDPGQHDNLAAEDPAGL